MLVAKLDLEMQHLFACTLEAEMPRLDDTCMDRTHGHFVNGFSFEHQNRDNSLGFRL
jgi:hypothetical protein